MKSIYYQFYKRFSEGEQHIYINNGKIIEEPKQYYWQIRGTYNHIQPMVELLKLKCKNLSDKDLYGKNGFVSQLMLYQRVYNNAKNRKQEFINRLLYPSFVVEDGSVDTDNLAEEGLFPGKVLVYRPGSQPPKTINGEQMQNAKDIYEVLAREEVNLLTQMTTICENFLKLKGESNE